MPTHTKSQLEFGQLTINRFSEKQNFFEAILHLVIRHQDLGIILKPKRRTFKYKFILGKKYNELHNFE